MNKKDLIRNETLFKHKAVLIDDVVNINQGEFNPSRSFFEFNWLSLDKHFNQLCVASQLSIAVNEVKETMTDQIKLLAFTDPRICLCNMPSLTEERYQHKFACQDTFFCSRCKTRQALVKKNGLLKAYAKADVFHNFIFLTITPFRKVFLNSKDHASEVYRATNFISKLLKEKKLLGYYWEVETAILSIKRREIKPHLHAILSVNSNYTEQDIVEMFQKEFPNEFSLNYSSTSTIDTKESFCRVIHYMNKPVDLAGRYSIENHNLTKKEQYDFNLSTKEIVKELRVIFYCKRRFSCGGNLKFSYKEEELKATQNFKERIKPKFTFVKLKYRRASKTNIFSKKIEHREEMSVCIDIENFTSNLDPPY